MAFAIAPCPPCFEERARINRGVVVGVTASASRALWRDVFFETIVANSLFGGRLWRRSFSGGPIG